jgi:hypothetical protein
LSRYFTNASRDRVFRLDPDASSFLLDSASARWVPSPKALDIAHGEWGTAFYAELDESTASAIAARLGYTLA